MVRSALAEAGKTQKELAEFMGWSPQNLSGRLKNDTLTFDELNKALGFVGYSVKMVSSTGSELLDLGNSGSPRVVQMVGGVTYDTGKAESLCTSKEHPDDKLYMELFKDQSGAYFLAYYQVWEGGYNSISPMSKSASKKFWARYSGLPESDMK
jgi:transcriptional regulator with XRE-family HTH domain